MRKFVLAALAACVGTLWGETRRVNVWYPGETVELQLDGAFDVGRQYELSVTDWQERAVVTRPYDPADAGKVTLTADDAGAFGAFRVAITEKGTTNTLAQTWYARLVSKRVEPCPWVGTGAHTQRYACYADGRYLDMLTAAGVGVVREDCIWGSVEGRAKGEYAIPEGYDSLFRSLEERGIRLNFLMTWANPLYENQLDPDGFAAFCKWTANHYKGRAKHYEIFNEPQHTPFRTVYPKRPEDKDEHVYWVEKFAELCRKAAAAIHAADPAATVAVTGEDEDWLLYRMIENGCAKKGDLVSFHPYCHTQPRPERVYWFKDGGAEMRRIVAAHGGCDRFCITEAGWTTFEGKMKYLEIAGCYPRASFEQQARYMTRMYILSHLTGIEYACQYSWMDEGQEPSYTEHHFGQLFWDATPKPSFAATAFLTRLLGKSTPIGDCASKPDVLRAPAFRRGDKVIVAAWAVEKPLKWTLPANCGTCVKAFDLMGNVIERPFVNGRTLELTENPVYLVFSGSKICMTEYLENGVVLAAGAGHSAIRAEGANATVEVEAGKTVTVDEVSGDYPVVKTGEGVLEVGDVDRAARLSVQEGVLRLTRSSGVEGLAGAAAIHLDAAKPTTLTRSGDTVTKWTDVRGTDDYPWMAYPGWGGKPRVQPAAQHGLAAIDLLPASASPYAGSFFFVENLQGDEASGDGYWASPGLRTIREIFLVVADNPGTDGNGNPLYQSFLADQYNTFHIFWKRGAAGQLYLSDGTAEPSAACDWRGGTSWLDGERVSSSTAYPAGFHLLRTRRSEANGRFSTLGYDREVVNGGMKYGEVIAFRDAVDDATAEKITQRLMHKWFGRQRLASLSVGENGRVEIADGEKLEVESAELARLDVTLGEEPQILVRNAALATTGVVNVEITGEVSGEVPLFAAETLTGAENFATGWKIVCTGHSMEMRPKVIGNALYGVVNTAGTILSLSVNRMRDTAN